ncbi:hypothetical protein OAQ99_01115 [Candidatus Kapabacteria bacterium]|nr:hypothetical protein [Candidatus Kapabacteria bacterium]
MKKIIIILFTILVSSLANSQVYVVVNTSVESDSVDCEKLLEIYTLNTNNWDDGGRITVIDHKGDENSKSVFYECIKINQKAVKKIRLKKLFTGSAKPPKSATSDLEILDLVSKTPGAVGYIDKNSLDTSIKNIKVVAVLDI